MAPGMGACPRPAEWFQEVQEAKCSETVQDGSKRPSRRARKGTNYCVIGGFSPRSWTPRLFDFPKLQGGPSSPDRETLQDGPQTAQREAQEGNDELKVRALRPEGTKAAPRGLQDACASPQAPSRIVDVLMSAPTPPHEGAKEGGLELKNPAVRTEGGPLDSQGGPQEAPRREAELERAEPARTEFARLNSHGLNSHGAELARAELARAELARAELAPAELAPAELARRCNTYSV
eukprot:9503838-Pyramimonas_sp.AAC.1